MTFFILKFPLSFCLFFIVVLSWVILIFLSLFSPPVKSPGRSKRHDLSTASLSEVKPSTNSAGVCALVEKRTALDEGVWTGISGTLPQGSHGVWGSGTQHYILLSFSLIQGQISICLLIISSASWSNCFLPSEARSSSTCLPSLGYLLDFSF